MKILDQSELGTSLTIAILLVIGALMVIPNTMLLVIHLIVMIPFLLVISESAPLIIGVELALMVGSLICFFLAKSKDRSRIFGWLSVLFIYPAMVMIPVLQGEDLITDWKFLTLVKSSIMTGAILILVDLAKQARTRLRKDFF